MPSPELPTYLTSGTLNAIEVYDTQTQSKVGLEGELEAYVTTKTLQVMDAGFAQQRALRTIVDNTVGNRRLPFMDRAVWDYALQPVDGDPTFEQRLGVFHATMRRIKLIDELVQNDGMPLLVIARKQDVAYEGHEQSMLYRTAGKKLSPRFPGVSKEEKPIFDFSIKASEVAGHGNHTSGYDLYVDVPALLAVITTAKAARESVGGVMGGHRYSKSHFLGMRATRAFVGAVLTRKPLYGNKADLAAELKEIRPLLTSNKK